MTQARVIVDDDSVKYEGQINHELSMIGEDFIKLIPFKTTSWKYACIILYKKEND